MNNQELRAIADAVSSAIDNSGEAAVEEIVKAITEGVRTATDGNESYILKQMSYLLQPWINPYYNDEK